jgi:uncharacterized protein YndB with AHSA1/START domain
VALIDQRILIDAPPQVIWEYISDPDRLTRWHAGYSGVSVLSTQRVGTGTRRRCTPAGGGKDVIEEITAWVDGLGYEYNLLEGGPYRSFQGRLRLQAGPDGTTVQWTISYHPKGLLGLIQNQLRGRRRLAQTMADSLRQLRRQIDMLGVRMDDTQRAKAGIQSRLDANERAQYQRRYAPPPGFETVEPVEAEAEIRPIEEQPPAPAPVTPEVPMPAVPSFVADLTEEAGEPDYSHAADTKPRPPEGLREAIAAQQAAAPIQETSESHEPAETSADTLPAPPERITPPEPAREVLPVQPPDLTPAEVQPPVQPEAAAPEPQPRPVEPEHRRPTPSHGIPVVRPAVTEARPDEPEETPAGPPREEARPEPVPGETAPAGDQRAGMPPQTPVHDTGEISIWEVFGVQRPSEQDTETLEALIQSVQKKKRMVAKRRARPRSTKRPTRVRRLDTVIGLRVWLALRAARIRLNKALYADED